MVHDKGCSGFVAKEEKGKKTGQRERNEERWKEKEETDTSDALDLKNVLRFICTPHIYFQKYPIFSVVH